MQVKTGDRVLLHAQAKAEPAEDVITRDYNAQLPQTRVTAAAGGSPIQPDPATEISCGLHQGHALSLRRRAHGVVNLSGRGMLVLSVTRQLGLGNSFARLFWRAA